MAEKMVADTTVKVPEMAESITEGTLKQFSKRELDTPIVPIEYIYWGLTITEVGDFVERDEELATIETDKVISFRWSSRYLGSYH